MQSIATAVVARNGQLHLQIESKDHPGAGRQLRFLSLSSRPGREFVAGLSPRNREQIEIVRGQYEARIGFTEDRRDSYPLQAFCFSSICPVGTKDRDLECAARARMCPTQTEVLISAMRSRAELVAMR